MSLDMRDMQIQTTMRYHYTVIRMANIEKKNKTDQCVLLTNFNGKMGYTNIFSCVYVKTLEAYTRTNKRGCLWVGVSGTWVDGEK